MDEKVVGYLASEALDKKHGHAKRIVELAADFAFGQQFLVPVVQQFLD